LVQQRCSMEKEVIELSNMLEKRAGLEAECFPVDRYFLQQYLDRILSVDRNDFLLCNLERVNNTYTVQLLLCLPELWEDISVDEILDIIKQFTNIFSYYSIIEFTHKYLEINIIELLLQMPSVSKEIKDNILDYLTSSLYPNLIKTEGDELFFREKLYGIEEDAWIYTKQRLLLDKRVKPAVTSLDEITKYVKSLRRW
jgi:hypothetical protein